MYQINKNENKIHKLQERTFSELGFKERENLQEWIANESSSLGEELLIIQKEFSGFDDTNERLDLLALDKDGALVIIENKLDDSGKDVTWQALKYASYCSSLSKDNILKMYQEYLDRYEPGEKAINKISEYYGDLDLEEIHLNEGVTQRIILIAANFRKEVTSTVLWLLNYNLRVQCFRTTPYSMGDELFLNIEQIIPTQDAEEYMIGMAEKAQEDIKSKTELSKKKSIRKKFFAKLIQSMNEKTDLYKNISPGAGYHWIGAGSGVSGMGFNFSVTNSYVRAELYIDRGEKEQNKAIYDYLFERKEVIEKSMTGQIEWDRLEDRRASRIREDKQGNIFEEENWEELIEFLTNAMVEMEVALKPYIEEVGSKIKNGSL